MCLPAIAGYKIVEFRELDISGSCRTSVLLKLITYIATFVDGHRFIDIEGNTDQPADLGPARNTNS